MSTVLDQIIERTSRRLAADKARRPLEDLKRRIRDARPIINFYDTITREFGIIAEIKKKSPSRGKMLQQDVSGIARQYESHPVVKAISVLTNRDDFDMEVEHVEQVAALTKKPILRKDFIFDEYQVYEARAFGADAILLMSSVVVDRRLMDRLFQLARELRMEVLFECRSVAEIREIPVTARIYGINSRKLKSRVHWGFNRYHFSRLFSRVGISDKTIQGDVFSLESSIPRAAARVAESGLDCQGLAQLREKFPAYNAALIGTTILNDPRGVTASLNDFEKAASLKRRAATWPAAAPAKIPT